MISARQAITGSVTVGHLPHPGAETALAEPVAITSGALRDDDEVGRYLPVLVRHAFATSWAGPATRTTSLAADASATMALNLAAAQTR